MEFQVLNNHHICQYRIKVQEDTFNVKSLQASGHVNIIHLYLGFIYGENYLISSGVIQPHNYCVNISLN